MRSVFFRLAMSGLLALLPAAASGAPRVAGLSVHAAEATLRVTFTDDLLISSVNSSTFLFFEAGPDGLFDTIDDLVVPPEKIAVGGEARSVDVFLLDPALARGQHRLVVDGTTSTDIDAATIALEQSGELRAPSDILARLRADLRAIRKAFPEMTSFEHVGEWVAGELLVGLTLEADEQFLAGNYHGLDDLNSDLGPVEIEYLGFGTLLLRFSEPYHPERLVELYAAAEGVEFADPNFIGGLIGKTRILAEPPRYRFQGLFGQQWVFDVADGQVDFLDEMSAALSLLAPSVLVDVEGNVLDGEFLGSFPSGDGDPEGDFVALIEWEPARFVRGDVDANRALEISDPIRILDHLFRGGVEPACAKSADADDSGTIDLTDAVLLLNHLFLSGQPPAEPRGACGLDPTQDALGCATFAGCV